MKALIIGIDALDSNTLNKLSHDLPNFSKLMESTPNLEFDGVFPPDSPTSWASIYTGLNPAKHGIVLFVDPLQRVSEMVAKDIDDSNIKGKTFWDIASEAGKKVCIMPHLLGYPVWPVNGVMIGRSGVTRDVQTYTETPLKLDLNQFKWDINNFPGRNKEKFLNLVKNQIKREKEFSLNMFKQEEWDVFFVSFGELDVIQYSFWNYYDKNDPSYPGENNYENIIPDFYKIFDELIGEFIEKKDDDTVVMIVSDHGIGSRPVNLININEYFRKNGLLTLTNEKDLNQISEPTLMKLKKQILKIIGNYDLGNLAAIGLKLFPKGKDWFIATPHINWKKSKAYLTDQSGIKNYPYGGIFLNNINDDEIESIINLIIDDLSKIKDDNGIKLFNWVSRPKDFYDGPFLNEYPEIIFELREDFGAGNSTPSKLYDKSSSHNIVPGCHKQHHASFLISEVNRNLNKQNMNLMDFTPTLLDILGIDKINYQFDGSSIFEK